MKLPNEILELAKNNNCEFISLKYLCEEEGLLKQQDFFARQILASREFPIYNKQFIPIKAFVDPFRSIPTISIYCEDLSSNLNSRKIVNETCNSNKNKFSTNFNLEISFWINKDNTNIENTFSFVADPVDLYANLRSDIISTLEKIGISTTMHYHGSTEHESVIGITGNSILDLADNFIISKLIIANCVASYGLKTSFSYSRISNLKILSQTNNSDIIKIYKKLSNRTEQIVSFFSNPSQYSFEVKNITTSHHTNNLVTSSITLETQESFIPYLSFLELLNHEIDVDLINEQLVLFFKKK